MSKDQQENIKKLVSMKKSEIIEELDNLSKISQIKGHRLVSCI